MIDLYDEMLYNTCSLIERVMNMLLNEDVDFEIYDDAIEQCALYLKRLADVRIRIDMCYNYNDASEVVKICEVEDVDNDEYNELRKSLIIDDPDYHHNIEQEFIDLVSSRIDQLYSNEFDL